MSQLRPLLKESLRVAAIMAVGDVICQTLVDKTPVQQLDVVRSAKYASIGFFALGPAMRTWYRKLDKIVPKHYTPIKRGIVKMGLDQVLFAPVCAAAMIAFVSASNGDNLQQIKQNLQKDYSTILIKNYQLWPAAQSINFSVIPLNYQVMFAQVVAIGWNVYLSLMLISNKE